MHTLQIVNPGTGRKCSVRAWNIDPHAILEDLKAGRGSREISWTLLEESTDDMAAEMDGDCSANNFSLSVFENALDLRLGGAVIWFLNLARQHHKLPKPFQVAVNRAGDVFIIGSTSRVYIAA